LLADRETKISNGNAEITKLAGQLDETKKSLAFYADNLKTKESIISEYQQEIKDKDTKQKNLEKAKEKRETNLNQNLSLKEAKIANLETNLLQLAKQKLATKKEAQKLVSQIEQK
jgi:hypothetical protein